MTGHVSFGPAGFRAARVWTAGAALAALVAAYAGLAPSLDRQHWDSLEYAWACEARGPGAIWGNHPLGHVVLCGAWRAARWAGYAGRALPLLSLVNAALGALAAVFFYGLLRRLGIRPPRAIGWTLVFAGSYGIWRYAGTADIYTLAVLLGLVAWRALLRASADGRGGSAAFAGVAAGLAVLAHQLNGPLLLAAAVAMRRRGGAAGRGWTAAPASVAAATAAAAILAGYLALGAAATQSLDPGRLGRWIVGYGADPSYGRFFGPAGLGVAAAMFAETLVRNHAQVEAELLRALVFAGMLAGFAAGAAWGRLLPGLAGVAVRAAAWQAAVALPLIAWWEPGHVGKFWLLALPAAAVLLAGGVEAVERRRTIAGRRMGWRGTRTLDAAALAIGAACIALNAVTIAREHRPNEALVRALDVWASSTTPRDVLIEAEDMTAHLLFQAGRPHTVNLYRALQAGHRRGDPFATLRRTIDAALAEGRAVILAPYMSESYFTPDRFAVVGTTREAVEAFFAGYRAAGVAFRYPARRGGSERVAYRLAPAGSGAGAPIVFGR